MKNFYTTINQAVKLAENEYGDWHDWEFNKEKNVYFYIKNYMKFAKVEYRNNKNYYYLLDGSGYYPAYDDKSQFPEEFQFYYCPFGLKKCDKIGINRFDFVFNKGAWNSYYFKNPIEPIAHGWKGTMDDLYTNGNFGCKKSTYKHSFCSTVIMLN